MISSLTSSRRKQIQEKTIWSTDNHMTTLNFSIILVPVYPLKSVFPKINAANLGWFPQSTYQTVIMPKIRSKSHTKCTFQAIRWGMCHHLTIAVLIQQLDTYLSQFLNPFLSKAFYTNSIICGYTSPLKVSARSCRETGPVILAVCPSQ